MSNADLLDRFLPGYRLVCRISASYLGLDLTDTVSKAFVLFAVLKSVQYLWSSLSSTLLGSGGLLTCTVEVPQWAAEGRNHGQGVYEDVLWWVMTKKGGVRARKEVVVVVSASSSSSATATTTAATAADIPLCNDGGEEKKRADFHRQRQRKVLAYEPAFDSTLYFVWKYRLISLRRQRGKPQGGVDTILLTCVGLSTQPLRDFLEECVESVAMGRADLDGRLVNGKVG